MNINYFTSAKFTKKNYSYLLNIILEKHQILIFEKGKNDFFIFKPFCFHIFSWLATPNYSCRTGIFYETTANNDFDITLCLKEKKFHSYLIVHPIYKI